jgi:Ca2+-transporting ATPase
MADTARLADFPSVTAESVLRDLGSSRAGLDSAEVRRRLDRDGPNVLRTEQPNTALAILVRQLRSLMVVLLVVAGAAALLSGDVLEGAAVLVVVLLNVALGFSMEYRAEHAMASLRALEVARAVVVRNGSTQEIDARDLVYGDVIELEAGRHVPADARVIDAKDLRVVESALTGESLPVHKSADPVPDDTPLADRTSMVYSGTAVVEGAGVAIIVATGMQTELGRIGRLLATIPDERTPLEKRLDKLAQRLAVAALTVGAVVSGIALAQGLPTSDVILNGVALAVAAVPEGLPAVATIALAFGVRRMARRQALVRRPSSVESLGAVTVVCADKTGTLTAGQMTVRKIRTDGHRVDVTGEGYGREGGLEENGAQTDVEGVAPLRDLLRAAVLANRAEVRSDGNAPEVRGDPTEAALLVAAKKGGVDRARELSRWPEIDAIPFNSDRMFMATLHRSQNGESFVAVKGSPGPVLRRCIAIGTEHGDSPMTEQRLTGLVEWNEEMSRGGLRVLAFARGEEASWRDTEVQDLTFLGLAGLIDPAADQVPETIASFKEAGIRVVMLTGDQKLTAAAVARELRILRDYDQVVDGREFARMSRDEQARAAERAGAFSRITAEDKLTIVSALRERGEIVAMIGDGVNDAAALRKADVGVSMGIRGTDTAREASAIVLRDDRFATIAAAIEEGRIIFDNIRKFVFYLFSCNLAEVMVLLSAGMLGFPLPLAPIQILWLNMVTDTFPALALAAEPGEKGIMRRPPRDPDAAILSRGFVRLIVQYASMIAVVSFAAWWIGFADGDSERARSMCFMTLGLAQAFHLGNARERTSLFVSGRHFSNPYATAALLLVVLLQVLAAAWEPLAELLVPHALTASDWGLIVALALAPAVAGQILRSFGNRAKAESLE